MILSVFSGLGRTQRRKPKLCSALLSLYALDHFSLLPSAAVTPATPCTPSIAATPSIAVSCRLNVAFFSTEARAPPTGASLQYMNKTVEVYVDASYKNGHAGYAYFAVYGKSVISVGRLHELCRSSSLAELNAIGFAKKSLQPILNVLLVKGDCESVIKGLNGEARMPHKEEALEIKEMDKQFSDVYYEHISRDYNSIADLLARTAREMLEVDHPIYDLSGIEEEDWKSLEWIIFIWIFGKQKAIERFKQKFNLCQWPRDLDSAPGPYSVHFKVCLFQSSGTRSLCLLVWFCPRASSPICMVKVLSTFHPEDNMQINGDILSKLIEEAATDIQSMEAVIDYLSQVRARAAIYLKKEGGDGSVVEIPLVNQETSLNISSTCKEESTE